MHLHLKAKKMAVWGALVAMPLFSGCSADSNEAASPEDVGALSLAITVDGYTVSQVGLNIRSEAADPQVVRTRTLDVSNNSATVSAAEYGLPADTYSVALSANVVDDPSTPADESSIVCQGSVSGVVVTAGATTPVTNLVLLCTVDGGQVRRAGGINIAATVDTRTINQCPDLVKELFVGPLETSVNGNVAISATLLDGASIAWQARAGTFSADRSQYTCPAIAGTYTLQATVTGPNGCSERVARDVVCRSTYAGTCDALPKAFAFEGSCGLRSPCHIEQNGCRWQANCRGQTFGGEGEGTSFPFVYTNGSVCSASVVDGELVGNCGSGENACDFATNSAPPPSTDCDALPATISAVSTCDASYASCSVVQDGCRYQANCDNGAAILNGLVVDDVLQWNYTRDGSNYRCEGPIADGAVQGTCTQRGVANPTSCEFAATVPPRDGPVCEATLPETGLAIEGCGLDAVCFPVQRGCAWALRCNGVEYAGTASATNAFAFAAGGKTCEASVIDGSLTGTCQGASESCGFATRAPVADPACYQVPAGLSFSGCGLTYQCDFLQDGCDLAIKCNDGEVYTAGQAVAAGISFAGTGSYQCSADATADGTLRGQCLAANGTNEGCEEGIVLAPL